MIFVMQLVNIKTEIWQRKVFIVRGPKVKPNQFLAQRVGEVAEYWICRDDLSVLPDEMLPVLPKKRHHMSLVAIELFWCRVCHVGEVSENFAECVVWREIGNKNKVTTITTMMNRLVDDFTHCVRPFDVWSPTWGIGQSFPLLTVFHQSPISNDMA